MREDEMAGWTWLNGHEFEQTAGDGEGQRSLAYCKPWVTRVWHDWVTEQQQHKSQGKQQKLNFNVLHPLDKLGYQLVVTNGSNRNISPALPSNNRAKFLCSGCTGSKSVLFKKYTVFMVRWRKYIIAVWTWNFVTKGNY